MNTFHPKAFDLASSSEAEYEQLNTFYNRMRKESDPDDPARSLSYTIKNLQSLPDFLRLHLWVIYHKDKIVASGNIAIAALDDNQHLAHASVEVLADWRQQGLAKRLLSNILDVAQDNNKTLLMETTASTIPAGEKFMRHLGAMSGLNMHINQLLLSDVKSDLIHTWQIQAKERAGDFELFTWKQGVPDEYLQAFSKVKQAINSQPRGELDMEDTKLSPEHLRQIFAYEKAKGIERWTMLVKHNKSEDFSGYTEMLWNPQHPQLLEQEDTAVLTAARNKGLGRWLKAAMIEQVKKDKPEARYIRTHNANSNQAMLKINQALGFKPYKALTVWQLEVDKLAEYLKR